MFVNSDHKKMLFTKPFRGFWLIPLGAVLGPLVFVTIGHYTTLPSLLVVPSLFYVVIFSLAIIGFKKIEGFDESLLDVATD